MGEGIEESCFSNSFRQVLFILANSSSPLVLVTSCTFPSQLRTLWYKLVCAQISSWLAWNSAFLSLLSHLPLIYLLSSFQNFVAFVFSPVLLILVVLCLFVLFFFFSFWWSYWTSEAGELDVYSVHQLGPDSPRYSSTCFDLVSASMAPIKVIVFRSLVTSMLSNSTSILDTHFIGPLHITWQ